MREISKDAADTPWLPLVCIHDGRAQSVTEALRRQVNWLTWSLGSATSWGSSRWAFCCLLGVSGGHWNTIEWWIRCYKVRGQPKRPRLFPVVCCAGRLVAKSVSHWNSGAPSPQDCFPPRAERLDAISPWVEFCLLCFLAATKPSGGVSLHTLACQAVFHAETR